MPVREAIRRLEAEGWVDYQRNHGASVRPLDDHTWAEAMAAVGVLDGYATALTAPHLGPADFERMRAANERMREAIEAMDVMQVSEHNLDFHRAIQDRCPNDYLRLELRSMQERLNTLRNRIFMFIPGRGRVSTDEHEQLVQMMEAGCAAPEIEAFARDHTLRTLAVFMERRAAMESA
jgi:DNA-binding GntR family transcriptional regulator